MSVKLQPTELQSCKSEITADFIVLDFDLFDISVLFSVLQRYTLLQGGRYVQKMAAIF